MSLNRLKQYISNEEFTEEELPGSAGVTDDLANGDEETGLAPETAEALTEAEVEVPAVDADVTDDDVEAADDEADDAEELADEDVEALDEAEVAGEENEEAIASVEHFVAVLQHGLKTKTFSPQFATTAQRELDKLNNLFGGKVRGTPSLESFDRHDMSKYYEASLESFTGFIKRLSDVGRRIDDYIPDLIDKGRLVNGYKKRAAAVNKDADALLRDLGSVTAAGPVKVTLKDKRLSGAESGILSALQSDLQLTTAAAGKGLKANEVFLKQVSDVLVEATNEGGVGKTGAIVAKAGTIKPAADAYPEAAFSGGFLGGRKLLKNAAAAGEGTRGAIKALQANAIPGIAKASAAKPSGELSFTKADLIKLVNVAKAYAALGDKAADMTGAAAIDSMKKVRGVKARALGPAGGVGGVFSRDSSAQATSWSEGKDLDALASALPKFLKNHIDVYRYLNDHALSVAQAAIALGWKAFGQFEDAAPKGE